MLHRAAWILVALAPVFPAMAQTPPTLVVSFDEGLDGIGRAGRRPSHHSSGTAVSFT